MNLGFRNHLAGYFDRLFEVFGDSFDFVIGSSHFVNCMDPYYPKYWELHGEKEAIAAYF